MARGAAPFFFFLTMLCKKTTFTSFREQPRWLPYKLQHPKLRSQMTCIWVLLLATGASAASPPAPSPTPLPGYVLLNELSDEFNAAVLDSAKWSTAQVGWRGRQPGLFDPANVIVANGALQLWARSAKRTATWPPGYDNYTTSAVHSLAHVRLGFFEIRWRSGSSGISSSFWFHQNNGSTWTEIDVFETTGVNATKGQGTAAASNLPSHVHIFALPDTPVGELPQRCGCQEGTPGAPPCSIGSLFSLPNGQSFADQFNVATLNWTEAGIAVALNGVQVGNITSPCLVQEIGMDFDRETMPGVCVCVCVCVCFRSCPPSPKVFTSPHPFRSGWPCHRQASSPMCLRWITCAAGVSCGSKNAKRKNFLINLTPNL